MRTAKTPFGDASQGPTGRALAVAALCLALGGPAAAQEAPAGFDNQSNGLTVQGDFDHDRTLFEQRHTPEGGLGPVYNAQSCAECHANPVTGGGSQVSVLRAGILAGGKFIEPPGGSVIHDRATHASLQSKAADHWKARTLRMSQSTLGLGYVEAVADSTLLGIAASQPGRSNGQIRGQAVQVDVIESPGAKRVGRFGWKGQHGSLLSFNAEAMRNEMGITNALFPQENTANGRSVAAHDTMADPENNGWLVALVTEFVRSTKAPPRDQALAASAGAKAGERLFDAIGCGICHVATLATAPAGTAINGGSFVVPEALGGKTIHPYSDFLLHDVGTGDGIVQNGGQASRNKLRTAPLWGLRTRPRLLHDGSALTLAEAIARHKGESSRVAQNFNALSAANKAKLLSFLNSL